MNIRDHLDAAVVAARRCFARDPDLEFVQLRDLDVPSHVWAGRACAALPDLLAAHGLAYCRRQGYQGLRHIGRPTKALKARLAQLEEERRYG